MIAEYGVARATLREALRLLEAQELIAIKAGPLGGPVVTRPSTASLSSYMANVFNAYEATLADLIEARSQLEPAVAALAAQKRSEEDLATLAAAVREMEQQYEDEEQFLKLNRLFHEALAKCTGNPIFLVMTASINSVGDGAALGVSYRPKDRLAVLDAHRQILETIRAGDPKAAFEATRSHLLHYRDYVARKYPDVLVSRVRPSSGALWP